MGARSVCEEVSGGTGSLDMSMFEATEVWFRTDMTGVFE